MEREIEEKDVFSQMRKKFINRTFKGKNMQLKVWDDYPQQMKTFWK